MPRLFDILVSAAALVVLLPLFLPVMLLLRLTGEGKVFFLQERVGHLGEHFRIFKFVTMRSDAEFTGNKDITVRGDSRVLPVGRFLRMTKINELPQILNVLRGDMALVGWRPLMPSGFADYSPKVQEEIVKIKPGLTGVGSLVFRDEEAIVTAAAEQGLDAREAYRTEIMPYKGEVELWYQANRGPALDARILVSTALAILLPFMRVDLLLAGLPQPQSPLLRARVLR